MPATCGGHGLQLGSDLNACCCRRPTAFLVWINDERQPVGSCASHLVLHVRRAAEGTSAQVRPVPEGEQR